MPLEIGLSCISFQVCLRCSLWRLFCNIWAVYYLLSHCRSEDQENILSCDEAALQMVFSVCLSVCPSVCHTFLAVTKQLLEHFFLSVRLSVCPSHIFHNVCVILSSWTFQELLPWTKVMSMQEVNIREERPRSQRSWPHLALSSP